MVRMMEFYRVRLPPTIISRVGDVDRHHACVVDEIDAWCCGKITRASEFTRQRHLVFCRREKVGGGLRVELSTLAPVFFDCRDQRVKSQLNLGSVIARFRGLVCTMTSEGQACEKVVVADGRWLTIEVLR
jgi:hypothetical protein